MSKFTEIGTPGIAEYMGFIEAAYTAELYWPACYPVYNRIRRGDPEIGIVRTGYSSLARRMGVDVVSPEDPTDDDKRAAEFYESELENVDGGIVRWLDGVASYGPFMGWVWWEALPSVRLVDWRPPDSDPWRSQADDGLIGIRRFAFRDHSSYDHWQFDEYKRLTGMWQNDVSSVKPAVMIPIDQSLHVTFGDPYSPEGLTPLEAVYRLERIKYGLEVVQGIGFEHSAGYLEITAQSKPDANDKQIAKDAARAILTAQEGNYALWTDKVSGKVVDTDFSAAPSILEAIRYYGLLKLQLYNMQWVAIASTAGTGAYSAMSDASSMFMLYWNSMMDNFVSQYDAQIGERLWKWNREKFPNATTRPRYKVRPLQKIVNLQELATFWASIKDTMPVGEDDYIEIRKQSGFLPLDLPEEEEQPEPELPTEDATTETAEDTAGEAITEDETSTEETPDDEEMEPDMIQAAIDAIKIGAAALQENGH